MIPLPPLRPELTITPAEQQGESFFVVRDPSGYAPHQLVITPGVLLVLHLLDGVLTREEVQAAFLEETGSTLGDQDLDEILSLAGDACMFDDERFFRRMDEVDFAFRESPIRLPACAGAVYDPSPDGLTQHLVEMIERAPAPEESPKSGQLPQAVIVPHVDYQRGYNAYGQLYRELATCPTPEVVVILGTAHEGAREPVVMTYKDFETPLGTMKTDQAIVERLSDGLSFDPFLDEPRHRNEHSIELQLPFLQHIWGNEVRIVPILCGSLFDFQEERLHRVHVKERQEFCERLHALATEYGERMLIMASADLSHMGPLFGDPVEAVDESLCAEVMRADRMFMVAALTGNAGGVAFLLEETRNATHICGGACIHTMLLSCDRIRGKLLGYHQAPAEDASQVVTFATACYYPYQPE